MTKKLEPVNCVCGKKAMVADLEGDCWCVVCGRGPWQCWIGPICKTRAGAVKAWNAVIEKGGGK